MTPETLLDGIVPFNDAAAALGRSSFALKRWANKPGGPELIYIGRFPHLNLVNLTSGSSRNPNQCGVDDRGFGHDVA